MAWAERSLSPRRRRRPRDFGGATAVTENGCFEDPEQFAAECGLTYVSDETRGITRQRRGRGFSYRGPSGKPLRDRAALERIRALVIPPAWQDVWICPLGAGHLQATGRDDLGRKQYLYHARWIHLRNQGKFSRMLDFGRALPTIRSGVHEHLQLDNLSREKVLGTVVRLLDTTFIRVGNLQYSRQNGAFGLTTLRDRHVEIQGAKIRFEFQGKSGVQHTVNVKNRQLARIVAECREVPGYQLFQYYDAAGTRQAIGSNDVNDYLRELTSKDFTAKDFRTWGGSVIALVELKQRELPDSETAINKQLVEVVDCVAERLGNTRAVCRQYYIHPSLFAAYEEGWLSQVVQKHRPSKDGASHALDPNEQLLMKVMRRHRRAC